MKALRALIGSTTRAKILLYMCLYRETYPRELTINLQAPALRRPDPAQEPHERRRGAGQEGRQPPDVQLQPGLPHCARSCWPCSRNRWPRCPAREKAVYLKPRMQPRASRKD